MGPFEAAVAGLAIVSMFVVMPAIIAFATVRSRRKGRGQEMRRSELDAAIGAAVDEATAPLRRRIETLEAIATATDGRLDPSLLDDPLEAGTADPAAGAPRRTRA